MKNIIKPKVITFTKLNTAELINDKEIKVSSLEEDEVLIKNLFSTISPGTERANITGQQVGAGAITFPRVSGYSNVGEVIAIGKKVNKFTVGDKVVTIWGKHASFHIMKETNLVKVPKGISLNEAALSFIGTFPLAAIRKVRLEIGENCAVIGLGLLGQFAIQFAKAAGAYPVIGVDINKSRRDEALKNGADIVLDPSDKNYVKKAWDLSNGGYTTAIEVTGVGSALVQTLEVMRKLGRVALLGCTRDYHFNIDYYNKVHLPGIELIGAHALARPNVESYPHYFTNVDDLKTILNLALGKRINLKGMIKETHSPNECKKVYRRLINEKNFPLVVQFDWSKLK